jgi:hypothetical protein
MELRIGETGMMFYEAHNPTDRPLAGTASFNVTPFAAGGYFAKIACFCFELQVLQPGERIEMPVTFYVDPAIVRDPEAATSVDHAELHHASRGPARRGNRARHRRRGAGADHRPGRLRPADPELGDPRHGRTQEPRLPHPPAQHLALHRRGRRFHHAGRRWSSTSTAARPGSR